MADEDYARDVSRSDPFPSPVDLSGRTAMAKTKSTEPTWRSTDETMVLPMFVTGGVTVVEAEPEAKPAAASSKPVRDPGSLPTDERNMLIFVASLLALGTVAIVALAGLGG